MEGNKKDIEKMQELKQAYSEPEMSGEQLARMKERMEEAKMEKRNKKKENQNKKNHVIRNAAAAAAAVAVVFVALPNTSESVAYAMSNIPVVGKLVEAVTFRDYKYESERNNADIEVPELAVNETALPGTEQIAEGTEQATDSEVQENLKKTTDEINAEIQKITDEIVAEFEENLEFEGGYQNVMVKHEVLSTTENYFTLKLICYQGSGSGAEWDYFYTIDLETGERLALKDLFADGADYITPISENIKEQMQEQMDADENVYYWLNDEIEEWNFQKITDETSFYLNEDGNIVISFNEGDVAPMYMGCVEFVIPNDVTEGIRK